MVAMTSSIEQLGQYAVGPWWRGIKNLILKDLTHDQLLEVTHADGCSCWPVGPAICVMFHLCSGSGSGCSHNVHAQTCPVTCFESKVLSIAPPTFQEKRYASLFGAFS